VLACIAGSLVVAGPLGLGVGLRWGESLVGGQLLPAEQHLVLDGLVPCQVIRGATCCTGPAMSVVWQQDKCVAAECPGVVCAHC
jgi:hypothetical protein